MRSKHKNSKASAERVVKDIRRATRKQYSAEEKIRIVLEGLRGDESIAELCRCEGIPQGVYYKWSKEFLEAGKRQLAGDTARAASTDEVKYLRRQARELKEAHPAISSSTARHGRHSHKLSFHFALSDAYDHHGNFSKHGGVKDHFDSQLWKRT